MMSIKHRSIAQSQPASNGAPAARLPDFCNLGIMLRLLLIVNLLCIAAAVVRMDARDLWQQFLFISAVAQPAIIFSLLTMCALRKPFAKLRYWQAIVAILFLEAIIGTMFWWWLEIITPVAQAISPWQYGFFFAFATGFALLYFDLRSRALSPALNEARLQALQARIRPHFLFNSINAVLSLIRAEPKRAERMLEDMSELFRVLMADNRKLTPLSEEIILCRRYLEIEDIRLGERLVVVWKIDAMPAAALVPPLILQPLVENAVFHGIEPRQIPGTLTIEIVPNGKQFSIRLTNPFHPDSTHVSGNRMAIANIKERLQLHFDAEASLKAEVRGDVYVVTITLPVRTEDL
jgi:two-component system, LytTR family, sensor histidine kinase AlgZ